MRRKEGEVHWCAHGHWTKVLGLEGGREDSPIHSTLPYLSQIGAISHLNNDKAALCMSVIVGWDMVWVRGLVLDVEEARWGEGDSSSKRERATRKKLLTHTHTSLVHASNTTSLTQDSNPNTIDGQSHSWKDWWSQDPSHQTSARAGFVKVRERRSQSHNANTSSNVQTKHQFNSSWMCPISWKSSQAKIRNEPTWNRTKSTIRQLSCLPPVISFDPTLWTHHRSTITQTSEYMVSKVEWTLPHDVGSIETWTKHLNPSILLQTVAKPPTPHMETSK